MFIMSYFSLSAVLFLLESMARAEALFSPLDLDELEPYINSHDNKIMESTSLIAENRLNTSDDHYQTFALANGNGVEASKHILSDPKTNRVECIIKDRKFEITELCDIFIGTAGKRFYAGIISVYMYGTLWVFGTVFGNSLSTHFQEYLPLSLVPYSYHIFLALFASIVVPISCMELTEQVIVQVTLSICRVFMILVMLSTILYADYTDTQPFIEFPDPIKHASLDRMDWSKLYIILPIAAYANVFHHSIPALAQPVQNKKDLLVVFLSTIMFCLVAYSCIGAIISTFFGDFMKTSSNLHWISYTGSSDSMPGQTASAIPLYAKFISTYVVCFPGLDVSSAFPLCAITLGNNLMSAYYGQSVHEHESNRHTKVMFRLLASLPPIVAASLLSDLGQVANFTGITGFAVAFVFPAILGIYSKKLVILKNKNNAMLSNQLAPISLSTYYSVPVLTSEANKYVTLLLGLFLIVFVISSLISQQQ